MIKMARYFRGKRLRVLVVGLLCFILLGGVLLTSGVTSKYPSSESLNEFASIYAHRSPYVGNSSKVVNLLSNLPYAEFRKEVSLKTSEEPYGITVKYETLNPYLVEFEKSYMDATFYKNAVIIFTLIENVNQLTFDVNGLHDDQVYHYTRADIQSDFPEDLRTYAQSLQDFQVLLSELMGMVSVYTTPSTYTPLMSSTPGIRFITEFNHTAASVRYTVTNGTWLSWEDSTVTMKGSTVEIALLQPIYWSPLDGDSVDFKEEDALVTITVLDSQGNTLAEKQVTIIYNGDTYYSVVQ